jgi:hypothetical protein
MLWVLRRESRAAKNLMPLIHVERTACRNDPTCRAIAAALVPDEKNLTLVLLEHEHADRGARLAAKF